MKTAVKFPESSVYLRELGIFLTETPLPEAPRHFFRLILPRTPNFPALQSAPLLFSGAARRKQTPSSKHAGADMLCVTMFDEVDEGTAIFKVINSPPVGPGDSMKFAIYEGLPSDYYLRLTGFAGKVIRGKRALTQDELSFPLPLKP